MKQRHNIIFCLFLCLLSSVVFSAPLSVTESALRDYVNQHHTQQLAFLKKISINSGTTNIAGVNRVGRIVAAELKRLGFKVKMVAEPKNMHRAATWLQCIRIIRISKFYIAHLIRCFKNSSFNTSN